jgi:hypothetical protein
LAGEGWGEGGTYPKTLTSILSQRERMLFFFIILELEKDRFKKPCIRSADNT